MNHRNTLNTRLLPLSILISSLVSGGAMAAHTTPTGDFQRVANGGSFQVISNSQITGNKTHPVSLIESMFPANQPVTEEMKNQAKQDLTDLKKSLDEEIARLQSLPIPPQANDKELIKIKASFESKIQFLEAVVAYTEDQNQGNLDNLNKELKNTVTNSITSHSAAGQFTAEEIQSLVGAALANDMSALPPTVAQKVEGIKQQQQAEYNMFDKLQSFVAQKVLTAEQAEKLKQNVKDKYEKLNAQAVAKTVRDEAKEDEVKAIRKKVNAQIALVMLKRETIKTEASKTEAEKKSSTLNTEKEKAIKAVNSNWSASTPDIEIELETLINANGTEKDKAEIALKAIKEAKDAEQEAQEASDKHTTATAAVTAQDAEYTQTQTARADAASKLQTKTAELTTATSAVTQLSSLANPTADVPAFEQTIAKNLQQDVAADTVAVNTNVAGGTQNVADKGKILNSAITEDGIINLAIGAQAHHTEVNKGTLNNNGGTDFNTIIHDGGALILKGEKVAGTAGVKDTIHIADSFDAKISEGGKAVVGEYAEIHNLHSTGGEVALHKGALAQNTQINGGTLTIAAGATAKNTTLISTTLDLVEGATADNTQVHKDAHFTLKAKAKTSGTHVNNDGKFTLEQGSSATLSYVTDGEMTVNDGASINDTNLVGDTAELILQSGANATDTKVHEGGVLTIESGATATNTQLHSSELELNAGATANDTKLYDGAQFTLLENAKTKDTYIHDGTFTVNANAEAENTRIAGGKFNLMARAQAHKLMVESGEALIAGTLMGATSLNGGVTTFEKTAKVSGNIKAAKDSIIHVYNGATTNNADLSLAGNMVLLNPTPVAARMNARAAFAGHNGKPTQFAFKDVKLAGGTVDMSQSNAQLTMASLAGKGHFNLGSTLNNHSSAPLQVTGNAEGTFDIQINNSGVVPTNLNVMDVQGDNRANVKLANGPVDLGSYQHTLVSDANGGYKLVANKEVLTPGSAGALAVANTTPVIFDAELSSIQNRLNKQSTAANESGVWVTYLNNNYQVKGTAANFNQKLNGLTFGGDKAIELGNGVLSLGGFASRSSSNIKSDYQSSGSVESNSLGAYAQYRASEGYYFNTVLKTNQFKQNLSVTSKGNNASGTTNFSGLGLAVKAGKHINVDAMYISPYVGLSSFTAGKSKQKLSNGMEIENQGSRTTTGTLGLNTGYRFVLNSGVEIAPYSSLSWAHDISARNDVIINNEKFDNSQKGSRANAAVGLNVNLTRNLSINSEVALSKGKKVETPMTINLGVAYTF